MTAGCLVCSELRGEVDVPGGFLWEDESVAAFHVPPLPYGDPRPYLGHLLIVTRRHVARLGDLSDDESAAGRPRGRAALDKKPWPYSPRPGSDPGHVA